MRFVDDLVTLDSIVRFDPLLETGEASPVLGINIDRNEQSILYAGFPVILKQALLKELEWLGSLVQCVTGYMTSCLQYQCYFMVTTNSI